MPRWLVKIEDDSGRARLILKDQANTIGMANMAWSDYTSMCRLIANAVLKDVRDTVESHLGDMVWADAQLASENSTELAMKRLQDLGWSKERVVRYAEELALKITQKLIDRLPEHT